jgi:two-component system sensor kinase FixL
MWSVGTQPMTHQHSKFTDHIKPQVLISLQSDNQSVATDASFTRRSFDSHSNKWSILMSTPYTPLMITFRIIVGIIISTLFAILIYQILVNRIRTQELNQKTKQLKTLFENLPGVAYRMLFNVDKGIEEHVEFLSEGFFPLSGYENSDIEAGKLNLLGLIHETDREMAIEKVKRAIVDNQMYDFECRFRNKNGDYMWVWHRGRAVEKTGSGLVFIEGLVTDITSKKHAELALLEARAYAEAIVDTAIEGVILIDSQGTITSFNASAEHIFGYRVDEVKGQNVKLLMPDNIKQEHDNYLKRYKNTNEAKIIGVGREMLARRKNGELFPIDLSVSEVLHQKSRTFVVLIRDISKQRAAEDEARLHRDQLAHIGRLNALGEMASGIAHEINQPLTSISLFAQAGKRFLQAGSVEEASQAFDKLSQHAHRAGAIIERIQGMTKHHQTEKVLTHCQVLLTEAAALGESEARIHDIKMVIKVEPDLPPMLVDSIQIQQVVLNLIRNAIQAMRAVHCKYGNVITIMARTSENGNIDIVVVDSGHGVSQQAEARLFDPFSSTKGQAMGMGLSISRAIVEAHGGQIYFKNNRGFGATFFFSLPAAGKDKNK